MTATRISALLAAAASATLFAGMSPASAGVNWNHCGSRNFSQLENTTRFTTETRAMDIQVRTHFRRADGTIARRTAWVDKGSPAEGTVLTFEFVWDGSHPEVAYSTSVWRSVHGDGQVHRVWRSNESTC